MAKQSDREKAQNLATDFTEAVSRLFGQDKTLLLKFSNHGRTDDITLAEMGAIIDCGTKKGLSPFILRGRKLSKDTLSPRSKSAGLVRFFRSKQSFALRGEG